MKKTKIIKIKNFNNLTAKDLKKIKTAAELIRNNDIVIFPTETVYGIGASIFSIKGIQKIYKVKNRPSDNPLIAHISNLEMLKTISYLEDNRIKEKFYKLIDMFWPGPLTVVVPAKDCIPQDVRKNLKTIAVRMPDNKIALNLIKYSNVPIVAPSANISGKPSGTDVKAIYKEFKDKVEMIIDGGQTPIGIESTVIDITKEPSIILRPGFITKEEIKKVLNNVLYVEELNPDNNFDINKINSPGVKYTHYKPEAITILIKKFNSDFFKYLKNKNKPRTIFLILAINKNYQEIENIKKEIDKTFKITSNKIKYFVKYSILINNIYRKFSKYANSNLKIIKYYNFLILNYKNLYTYASLLYKIMREADENHVNYIIFESPEPERFGYSLLNRLKKASEIHFE